MVVPVSCQMRRSSSLSRSRVISSSAPNGSSMSKRRGPPSKARAIETRSRIPPERSCGKFCSQPSRPTSFKSSRGVGAPDGSPAKPPTSAGSSTFCRAVRHGSSAASWNTKPSERFWRASCGDMPNTESCPAVGVTRSATIRSRVDFPHPDGPSRVRKPPRATEKEMFSSAVTVRRSVMKRIKTLRHETALASATAGEGTAGAPPSCASISADLRPGVGGHLENVQRHDVLELRCALRELADFSICAELDLPEGRIHRAPAFGLGAWREREPEHRIERLDFILGIEIGEFLNHHLDRLYAVGRLIRKAPAFR